MGALFALASSLMLRLFAGILLSRFPPLRHASLLHYSSLLTRGLNYSPHVKRQGPLDRKIRQFFRFLRNRLCVDAMLFQVVV